MDAQGQAHGLYVDLLPELARRSGCELRPEPSSASRVWTQMQSGYVHAGTGLLYRPERKALADFILLSRTRLMLLVRQPQATAWDGPAGLLADRPRRVGVVRGAGLAKPVSDWVQALRAQGRVSESGDMPALLRAFEAGRLDAILIYPLALHGRSEAWHAAHRLLDWWPRESVAGGIALSRTAMPEGDRARLREAMLGLLRDGTVQRAADRHLGKTLGSQLFFVDRLE
jgi:polar amino acid transport system substrate-binding protein